MLCEFCHTETYARLFTPGGSDRRRRDDRGSGGGNLQSSSLPIAAEDLPEKWQ